MIIEKTEETGHTKCSAVDPVPAQGCVVVGSVVWGRAMGGGRDSALRGMGWGVGVGG